MVRNARLWTQGPGSGLKELPHKFALAAALFSPDGRTLVTADWNISAWLWDTDSRQLKAAPLHRRKWITALAFSADGRLLATGSFDGTAALWDAATGALRARVGGCPEPQVPRGRRNPWASRRASPGP
jgi:WD40 repeat protein